MIHYTCFILYILSYPFCKFLKIYHGMLDSKSFSRFCWGSLLKICVVWLIKFKAARIGVPCCTLREIQLVKFVFVKI